MQWFHLRPTFEILLEEPPDEVRRKLTCACQHLNDPSSFFLRGDYGELHLPPAQHRLWSPHLGFSLDSSTHPPRIHGRFAPRLEIWSLVWIGYLAFAFTAFFASMLAISQWLLNHTLWGLPIALAAIAGLATLYLTAHIGQQLSADQMLALRAQLDTYLLSPTDSPTNRPATSATANASTANAEPSRPT
jgi:hypothetical protein